MKHLLLSCCFSLFIIFSNAQSVGIGTITPHASAALDIQSSNKGILLPRVTTAQRKAIANPEPGLMVFDTDKRTIMLYEGTKWGQLVFKDDEITAPTIREIANGQADDYFGNSVSLNNDYAAVGAYKDDVGVNANQGSIYVFHRVNGTWLQEAQLFAADGAANDLFGYAVAISGDYIVAGAPEDNVGFNSNQGSVYVFVRNGVNWTQQHKFLASDGAADDQFGYAVAIDGNQFIVGTPQDDVGANTNQGSVTIYLLSSNVWAQELKLMGAGGLSEDQFGSSVAISGLLIIVAAVGDDNTGSYQGAAYIYQKVVNWTFAQRLQVSGSSTTSSFANAIAISGTTAVVTERYFEVVGFAYILLGRVHIYIRNGFVWSEQTVIEDPYYNNKNFFAQSLSLDGDKVAIASTQLPNVSASTDSSYVSFYKRNGTVWEEQRTIFNSPAANKGGFALAVFLNGFNAIIGAPERKSKKGEISFVNIE